MLTRMLEEMGLFVGSHKDENHEALFFVRINQWLLTQCGGSWDNPAPIHYLLDDPSLRRPTIRYIGESLLKSPRTMSYMGLGKYLRYRSVFRIDVPWGWKDPRNTYTLPMWLELFPDAKVIHIRRQGEAVARSLQLRGRTNRWYQKVYYRLPVLHWFRPRRAAMVRSPRCESLEGGLSLWREYLAEASRNLGSLPGPCLELQYEEILQDPVGSAERIACFSELTLDSFRIRAAADLVRSVPPRLSTLQSNAIGSHTEQRPDPVLSDH